MKILFIAMPDSIHTARWINQISDQGWEISLYSSYESTSRLHNELKNITFYSAIIKRKLKDKVNQHKLPIYSKGIEFIGKNFWKDSFKQYRAKKLAGLIEKIKPDVIHSLEFQHAGYLTLEAKKLFKGKFPSWIATNWGSDIYLFSRLSQHESKIKEVLANCDYYSCECHRDVSLARELGFKGQALPVFPNTGGFDISLVTRLRQEGPTSNRKIIMLKGYQGWAGRALVGLRALERCAELLKEYTIAIFSPDDVVAIAAELFQKSTGIETKVIPRGTTHQEILMLHGRARISIGLSISDGISTSLLEAMVMGSFPIQSYTACADEWIEDGKSGLIVHPDDPESIEKAIRRALTEDALVDEAANINFGLAEERLNKDYLKMKTIDFYNTVLGKN